ncbi:nucleotidyltransferase domain-containing protein [Agrobacterium sp. SHOUNA12C]|jgi:predicted nucleotidyltransferase|uniref:nucleotidyltransferase domain-containing protein n=1 Tax=Rhizobium rhizogenes TaxID=359 RepID=UPI0015749A40|nr:nucleotidyltransferase domain-containing protein [Rhizobium rhizogenes]MCJ9720038.1 nucleotidyltransferase domain-containing protein [Agrobacterium sp. BETTINA12B]MCJ9755027.1 nucleotidyltransferase domain-containing protein [Agrobacterium sp. SHOUNA12C]NTF53055.1 nucleotidyltransferase domain-containing protein [Rhizobium rhizogenes]NTG18781.1 nucleotidyltransferase domain-containing protein [Rhizobium rhizogenes]NTH03628.1 nucleotidyltransferase domain-containing protein [Rhizobium rhizog
MQAWTAPFEQEIRDLFRNRFLQHADAIVLVGSQARGYATSKSDIDLILLMKGGSDNPLADNSFLTEVMSGIRTEILILKPDTVEARLKLWRQCAYRGMNYEERRFIEKVTNAIPIVGKSDWEKVLENFSKEEYQKQVLHDNLIFASKTFDDAAGLYCDGDHLGAVETVRSIIQVQLEALLCTLGDTGERRRWLLRRLRVIEDLDPRVIDGFIEFNFNMINRDYTSIESWSNAAMRFHQFVQYMVFRQTNRFASDLLEEISHSEEDIRYITPDWMFLNRIQDKWYAKTLSGGHIIDTRSALILMLCHKVCTLSDLEAGLLSAGVQIDVSEDNASVTLHCVKKLIFGRLLVEV